MIRVHSKVRIKGIEKAKKGITNHVFAEQNRRVKKALNYLFDQVMLSVSVRAWSKDQLRRMGHPYAAKHGNIKKGAISPRYVYQVGSKTGRFKSGFKKEFIPARRGNSGQAVGKVYYEDGSQWAEAIFRGSKRMLPRNPIRGVSRSRPVKRRISEILKGSRS